MTSTAAGPAPAEGATASAPASIPGSRPKPISRAGAVFRLILGMIITGGLAVQTAHGQGVKIDHWVLFGVTLLVLKDLQSYLSQTWGQAFHGEPGPNDPA